MPTELEQTIEEVLREVITEKMALEYLVETEGYPGDAEERHYFNTEAGAEYRQMLINRAKATLLKAIQSYGRAERVAQLDELIQLEPYKQFMHWKQQDIARFFEQVGKIRRALEREQDND